ncbi:hypothetical protein CIK05_06050 [Bdellovibrio sp. qaytius]|nr:hypothetical protein CIK05_06050 [Bdellovibrio sp. qaytius]
MNIDHWIQSTDASALENILVDLLLVDGYTYSGYINYVAFKDHPESILLTSRSSKAGIFVGKKIQKKEIIGFNFSTAPRTNFGFHHIYLAERDNELHFQHAIHDQYQISVTHKINSKLKFVGDCFLYLQKINAGFLPNEQITLVLFRQVRAKYCVDSVKFERKVKEFLQVYTT